MAEDDEPDDPARAFKDMAAEVAVLRRAVEAFGERLERIKPRNYDPTLGDMRGEQAIGQSMPAHSEPELDVASFPEFENLVAEISMGSQLTIVISKEPNEDDFGVAFYGSAGSAKAPSYSSPRDAERLPLSDVLAAIELGRKALEG